MTAHVSHQTPRPAWRSPGAMVLFVCVCGAMLSTDLAVKAWAFANVPDAPVDMQALAEAARKGEAHHAVPPHEPLTLAPSVLAMKLTTNQGAIFGLWQGRRFTFVVASILALGVIGYFFAQSQARDHLLHVALALVLAGALGNLYDRIVYHCVRDMMWLFPGVELPFAWRWPQALGGSLDLYPWLFNIADVCLLVGVLSILIRSLFVTENEPASPSNIDP